MSLNSQFSNNNFAFRNPFTKFFTLLILLLFALCYKMLPSRLFGQDSRPSFQNSISSLHSASSFPFGPITHLELYPRRRQTEFYYEPQPMMEYQSRTSEHPQDKLQRSKGSKNNLEGSQDTKKRINPPRNSDMRMFRDSYFS